MVRCLLGKTRKGIRKGMPTEETVCTKLWTAVSLEGPGVLLELW